MAAFSLVDIILKAGSDPKGALLAAGTGALGALIGGDKDTGGAKSASAAADATTIGFAKARQLAESHKAEDRASTRILSKEESEKRPSRFAEEVNEIYFDSFRNSNVRQALIQQMEKQGLIDHSALTASSQQADDTAPTVKPKPV